MLSPFMAKCSIGMLSRRGARRSALSDSVSNDNLGSEVRHSRR